MKTSSDRLAVVVGMLILAIVVFLTCPGCMYIQKNNIHHRTAEVRDVGWGAKDTGRTEVNERTQGYLPVTGKGNGWVSNLRETNTTHYWQANTGSGYHDRTVVTNYFQDTSWKAGCESPFKGIKINILSGNRCGCGVYPCHHTDGYYGRVTYGTTGYYYPPGAVIVNPGPSVYTRYPDQHSTPPGAMYQCPTPRYVPYRR